MNDKIRNKQQMQWSWILSRKHIEYATEDTYTAFEIWNRITTMQNGLTCALREQTVQRKRQRSS